MKYSKEIAILASAIQFAVAQSREDDDKNLSCFIVGRALPDVNDEKPPVLNEPTPSQRVEEGKRIDAITCELINAYRTIEELSSSPQKYKQNITKIREYQEYVNQLRNRMSEFSALPGCPGSMEFVLNIAFSKKNEGE